MWWTIACRWFTDKKMVFHICITSPQGNISNCFWDGILQMDRPKHSKYPQTLVKNMYSISKLWGKTTCLRIQTEGLGMFRPFKIRVLWGTVFTSLQGVVVGFAITWQHVNMLDSTKRKSGQRLGIITSAIYIYTIYNDIYIYIYDIFFQTEGKVSGQGWKIL
jgi:hypothetical protein